MIKINVKSLRTIQTSNLKYLRALYPAANQFVFGCDSRAAYFRERYRNNITRTGEIKPDVLAALRVSAMIVPRVSRAANVAHHKLYSNRPTPPRRSRFTLSDPFVRATCLSRVAAVVVVKFRQSRPIQHGSTRQRCRKFYFDYALPYHRTISFRFSYLFPLFSYELFGRATANFRFARIARVTNKVVS
jgi:hypothetical protein